MATSDRGNFERLRPLGALEQFSSARHHLGFYLNVGVSGFYSCPTKIALSVEDDAFEDDAFQDIIFGALEATIIKHPVLSTFPVDEDSSTPYFARLPRVELGEAVIFCERKESCYRDSEDVELDSILQLQHNIGFTHGSPFWRLVIVTDPRSESEAGTEFTACFIFHHCLGDGASGTIFHKDFLAALRTASSVTGKRVLFPAKKDLLPNLELLHPLSIASQPRHTPVKLWSGEKVTLPTSSRFRSLYLSHSSTQKLIQACKRESTTITATIPVIVATVLMKLIPIDFEELECTVPVGLRRWMPFPVTEDSFGVWIDAFSQYYRRENTSTFSWDEARRSRETIKNYLNSNGNNINVAKFQKIKDMRQFFLSRVGMERGTSFDCSNLGSFKGTDSDEPWKVGRMLFSRSAFVSGSAIAVGVLSGGDGCLSLGFSWQVGIVSNILIAELIEGVHTEIEKLKSE